jgi:hypothetical protein
VYEGACADADEAAKCDLPGRVSLVVTELVDSGLLGEHILATLRDARLRLLQPSGLVVPHSAQLIGLPICSRDIARRDRLQPHHRSSSEGVSTLRLSLQSRSTGAFKPNESYTCESLGLLEHTPLSEPLELCRTIVLDGSVSSSPDTEPILCSEVSARAIAAGSIDALACWFRMFLVDPALLVLVMRSQRVIVSNAGLILLYQMIILSRRCCRSTELAATAIGTWCRRTR